MDETNLLFPKKKYEISLHFHWGDVQRQSIFLSNLRSQFVLQLSFSFRHLSCATDNLKIHSQCYQLWLYHGKMIGGKMINNFLLFKYIFKLNYFIDQIGICKVGNTRFSTPNDALRIALLQRVVPLLRYFQRKPVIAQ